MTAISKCKIGLAMCCCIIAAGCASKEKSASIAPEAEVPVSCIAVLPVQPSVDFEDVTTQAEQKALKDGSQVMYGQLKDLLSSKINVKFPADGLKYTKEKSGTANNAANARKLADQAGCNAVLETTLSQYTDRVGGQYGVKEPAAVTFSYRVFDVGTGKVLCHGRFDEKQQSVMENLFTLSKAQSRGLSWLTAEELMRDGLKERLGQCSYLEGK